jgi:Concanavalin A-like lectin/glucanases superfamily
MSLRSNTTRSAVLAAALTIIALAAPSASFAIGPLAGWWPMNEGKGQTIYDWSGNGNNGVLGTTPGVDSSDPTWIQGRFGSTAALSFDGSDDVVTIPRSASLETQRLTVSAWLRATTSPGPNKYVVAKGAQSCDAASYGLYTGAGGGIAFYIFDGTNFYVSPAAPASVWDNSWHNAAGTFDGDTVRLYVDGRQVGSGTPVPSGTTIDYPLADTGNGNFGDYPHQCGLQLKGDIDTVRIWNMALPVDRYWTLLRALFSR